MKTHRVKPAGFSLLELAVVLAIIGLIIGGVVAGQSIIKMSELNSLVTDLSAYKTATTNFQDKYSGLPGDIKNAVYYWSTAKTGGSTADGVDDTCQDLLVASTDAKTCNGNGNGKVDWYETWRGWQQLINAGFISGKFTGISADNPAVEAGTVGSPGVNMHQSKIEPSMGLLLVYVGSKTSTAPYFDGDYGNAIRFGSGADIAASGLLPDQAYAIDKKTDDGMPSLGKTRTYDVATRPNCVFTAVAPGSSPEYLFSDTTKTCNMLFITDFGNL